jgi:Zn-dependent protease
MLLIVGFGWAKPVPVNLENIPAPQRRKGLILVSAAGVTANIIIAFVALLLWRLLTPEPGGMIYQVLYTLSYINILLAAFNLIPIPPLDGSKILMGFTPESFNRVLYQIEPFGFFIVLGLPAAAFICFFQQSQHRRSLLGVVAGGDDSRCVDWRVD